MSMGDTHRYWIRMPPATSEPTLSSFRSKSGWISHRLFKRWDRGKRKLGRMLARLKVSTGEVTAGLLPAACIADSQVRAPLGTAARQKTSSVLCRHARTESVLVRSFAPARLVRTLHCSLSLNIFFSLVKACFSSQGGEKHRNLTGRVRYGLTLGCQRGPSTFTENRKAGRGYLNTCPFSFPMLTIGG